MLACNVSIFKKTYQVLCIYKTIDNGSLSKCVNLTNKVFKKTNSSNILCNTYTYNLDFSNFLDIVMIHY